MEHWGNNKMKQWSPEKLFAYFYEQEINSLTHFPPGKDFHYSDVNYFLLGLIIEQVSGTSLPQQIRERILVPLDLKNTWFEYYEEPTGHQKVAHSFQGPENVTLTANTSFDWSGGGLISTTHDLNVFINAVMKNELFKKQETLTQMMDICQTAWGFEYGLGLIAFDLNGTKYYGHSGFWGVVMIYQPELKQTLCLCFSQAAAPFNYMKFSADIIQIANMK